jgi:hypothetical protein
MLNGISLFIDMIDQPLSGTIYWRKNMTRASGRPECMKSSCTQNLGSLTVFLGVITHHGI